MMRCVSNVNDLIYDERQTPAKCKNSKKDKKYFIMLEKIRESNGIIFETACTLPPDTKLNNDIDFSAIRFVTLLIAANSYKISFTLNGIKLFDVKLGDSDPSDAMICNYS